MSKKIIVLLLCISLLLPAFGGAMPVVRAEEIAHSAEAAIATTEAETVSTEATTAPTEAATEPVPTTEPAEIAAAAVETTTETTADFSEYIGKYATFQTEEFGYFFFMAEPNAETEDSLVYDAEDLSADLTVVITDWQLDSIDGIWYKIEAAPGNTLPEDIAQNPWILDGYVGDEVFSLLKFDPPTEDDFTELELSKTSDRGIQVGVTGELPAGTQLSVQDVTIDPAEYGVEDAADILAALDIRLLGADGTEYQPYTDEKEVIVTIDAEKLGLADGDVVRLHHNHEGKITVYDPYVVIGGKLTFWTDRFSTYIVSDIRVENKSQEITDGSTYTMTIGEKVVFWANYGGNRAVWKVENPSSAVEYKVIGKNDPGNGYAPNWAQWIEIKAKGTGEVNITFVINGGYPNSHSFKVKIVAPSGLYIDDKAAENGCLVPAWSADSTVDLSKVRYTWTRDDGQAVRMEALQSDGSVNISIDRGGATTNEDGTTKTITYTVTATDLNGAKLDEASFEVLYGNEILNPSFEKPGGFGGGYTTFYNGYPGLYWKTTAPGEGGHLGQDIEVGHVNGNPYGIYSADGNYFVELNAENFGALYQDMLTTPSATLTWSFSHAKRKDSSNGGFESVDSMYVIVAATQYAQTIINKDNIDALLDAAIAQAEQKGKTIPENTGTTYPDGFEFDFTDKSGQTGTYRIWHSAVKYSDKKDEQWHTISGSYEVPEGQYLTRLFFASDTNDPISANSTLGNMIDGVKAGEFMNYIVEYYKGDALQSLDTEKGKDSAYEQVTLKNLAGYLNTYKYPFDIQLNGKPYPGTIKNLQTGLLLTDYGAKEGDAANSAYDAYDIVLKIVFQDPNIRVTKVVEIEGWEDWTTEEKQALLDKGITADFKLTNQADSTDTHTTQLKITQLSDDGKLTSASSFPHISEADFGKLFTVTETSATKIVNYAVQTTIDQPTIGVKSEAGERIKNVTVTNRYVRNVGNLTIKKDVLNPDGYALPADDEFTFVVSGEAVTRSSYMVSINNGEDTAYPVTDGKLTITLKAGQWAVIKNLDLKAYQVQELPHAHYTLTGSEGDAGTIVKENTAHAGFTNTYSPNEDLRIEKFVDLGTNHHIPINEEQAFTFRLKLNKIPSVLKGPYSYAIKNYTDDSVVSNGTLSLDANKTLTFSLKHNQYILIQDFPETGYTLTEDTAALTGTYDAPYYYIGSDGPQNTCTSEIARDKSETVRCYNPLIISNGDLQITKRVDTADEEANVPPQPFAFTITLNNALDIGGQSFDVVYTCDAEKGTLSADKTTYTVGGNTYNLTQPVTVTYEADSYVINLNLYDGLTATIQNLPPCGYHIVEADYSAQTFSTTWEGETTGFLGGLKVDGKNPVTSLTCINTYNVTTGKLEITKNVKKEYDRDILPAVTFNFTVTPDEGITLSGNYTVKLGEDDENPREVAAQDNKLVVQIAFTEEELKNLQLNDRCAKTLIVSGLPIGSYTITETKIDAFKQDKESVDATIGSTAAKAEFTNTYKRHLGELKITKNVTGTNTKDPVLVKIKEGTAWEMVVPVKPGEPVTIYDLELGKTYTVTELIAWNWQYTAVEPTSSSVQLTEHSPNGAVTFTNTYTEGNWLSSTTAKPNKFTESTGSNNG